MRIKLICVLVGIVLGCIPSFGQNGKRNVQVGAMPVSKQGLETVEMRRAGEIESYITYSETGEPLYMVKTGDTYEYYKWENNQWVTDPDYSSPSIFYWNIDMVPYMEIKDGQFRFHQPGINSSYYTYWDWDNSSTYSEKKDSKGRLSELYINDRLYYGIRYDNLDRLIAIEEYNWEGVLDGQTQYEYHLDTDLKTLMDWTRYDFEKGKWVANGWKEIRTYNRLNLPDGGYRDLVTNNERYEADSNGNWGIGNYKSEATYDSDGDISTVRHYTWAGSQWVNNMYTIVYPNGSDYVTFNNTLFKYYGDGGNVVIPDDLGITTIGESAFESNSTITSVVIPDGVTEIGQSAFMNCEKLSSVSMPNTVTTIKEEAFFNSKLETVAIPNAVATIGTGAFGACETLTAISVNSTNTVYSSNEGVLFDKSQSLLHTYPGGKTGTFAVPATVTKINDEAFYGSNVAAVAMNDKTQSIGDKAFNSCKELTSIDIPSSVSTIGQSAFENSSKLEAINVSGSNNKYSSEEGILYDKNKTQLITYPENKQGASVDIPGTVSSIENAAFSGSKLISVNIPSSVTSIKESAFKNNSKLEAVEIPSSVKTIQNLIFSGCTELKDVTIKWTTPLSVPEDIFKGVNTANVTLHVPVGKESAYKNAEVWKNFNITSTPVSTEQIEQASLQVRLTGGILYVAGLQAGETVSIYNISGQLVHKETANAEAVQIPLATTKGVLIVTTGEKTVKVIEK